VEPAADGIDEVCEGLLVATLRPDHDRGIHFPHPRCTDFGAFREYGKASASGDSIFVAAPV
jgi:hypothetical protein